MKIHRRTLDPPARRIDGYVNAIGHPSGELSWKIQDATVQVDHHEHQRQEDQRREGGSCVVALFPMGSQDELLRKIQGEWLELPTSRAIARFARESSGQRLEGAWMVTLGPSN